MALPYRRNEVKERARAEWRGACNVTLPSFASDFACLNEAGIGHDVRRAAELGFWGTLVASESGTTFDEYLRFMQIAADSTPRSLKLVAHASFDTVEQMLRVAQCAEELGYEALLLSYPPCFQPQSPQEIVDFTRAFADKTDMALLLFGVMTWGFKRLHPSGFPPEALQQMARLETAAAIKYEANPPAMPTGLADLLHRCGTDVLVCCPLEQYAPALVDWFGMQWMGTSSYESFGDRVPRWFKLLHDGKWDEAMQLYWSCQSARDAKGQFHASFAGANLVHRNGWKYMSWLQGFNGGLLRMPQMRLNPNQMRALRQGMVASGFKDLPADDSGFYAGRNPA
jgi:dihydrodipicolinate synthase/N-acetylneuraminate lyase